MDKFMDSWQKIFGKFWSDFNQLSDFYTDFNLLDIESALAQTTVDLLNLKPEILSFELSYEKSLVFTFINKQGLTIFFERYLDCLDSNEEVIFSYNKDDVELVTNSTYLDALSHLQSIL